MAGALTRAPDVTSQRRVYVHTASRPFEPVPQLPPIAASRVTAASPAYRRLLSAAECPVYWFVCTRLGASE
jgi:hypothetical protein